MKNPWKNMDDAFEPMYDEQVEIVSGENHQTLNCIVMRDNTGEVLSDEMLDTDRHDVIVLLKKDDWAFAETIQRGDIVKRLVGSKVEEYSVYDVIDDVAFGKVVKARSK